MAANEWTERTRLLVTAGIALTCNLALGGWFYSINGVYQQKFEEHAKNKKKIATLKDQVKDLEVKKTELASLETEIEKKMKQLPEEEEVTRLIDNISTIAAKTNCKKNSASISRGTTPETIGFGGGNFYKDTWHTTWEADFMSWCTLMNEMEENFGRFVSFENLMLTPKNSGVVETGEIMAISVDVVTYRYAKGP